MVHEHVSTQQTVSFLFFFLKKNKEGGSTQEPGTGTRRHKCTRTSQAMLLTSAEPHHLHWGRFPSWHLAPFPFPFPFPFCNCWTSDCSHCLWRAANAGGSHLFSSPPCGFGRRHHRVWIRLQQRFWYTDRCRASTGRSWHPPGAALCITSTTSLYFCSGLLQLRRPSFTSHSVAYDCGTVTIIATAAAALGCAAWLCWVALCPLPVGARI